MLEALRSYQDASRRQVRFYQAAPARCSAAPAAAQNEDTRFQPRSPYACAKVDAHHRW